MAAVKNHAKAGGRKKGVPNKVTTDLREKITIIIESQVDNILPALEEIRRDNPVQYVSLMEKIMGYALPKKRDITSDDKAIMPAINIYEDRTK